MEIIEFIGNPGCGKSTITEHICNELSRDKRVLNFGGKITKVKKILYSFSMFFINPFYYFYLLNIVIKSRQPSIKTDIKIFLNITFLSGALSIIGKTYDYIIFDQGIIQGIWSILLESKTEIDYNKIIYRLPTKYKIIYIEVGNDILKERLQKRDTNLSRFEKNPESMDLEKSNRFLKELFENFTGPKVIIDNSGKLNIEEVKAKI